MSSVKLLHFSADENPDLHKQIGSMTGIFQVFDRQHVLSDREITHKRASSSCLGALQLDNGPDRDFSRKHETDNEQKRGISTESTSRASFSSSCSSFQDPNDQLKISNDLSENVGKSQIRPPGVVAKLMGLEPLLDSAPQKENSFTKKPLRTMEVKQILDAIQSNWVSEDKVSNFVSPKNTESRYGSSPIVIMKSAKIVERHGLLRSSSVIAVVPFLNLQKFEEADSNGRSNSRKAKTRSSPRKNINNDRKSTMSVVPHSSKRQSGSSNSVKKSMPLSLNLQQKKKLELPSALSKSKNKHSVSFLKMEGELISSVQPLKELSLQLREDKPRSEHVSRAAEHPSPVSVLDLSEYTDDELPPKNQESHFLKDHSTDRSSNHHNHVGENWCEPPLMNHQKLLYINNLLQNLRNLNPNHDEEHTDYIASLCENCTNPDHKYIAEILLISGLLLTDLSSDSVPFKLHPSGHPINPELFHVLEKTKTCLKPNKEKIHRRLVFDNVNEILLEKLGFAGSIVETRVRYKRVAWNARKLLKELCFEIDDQLEATQRPNDIVSERWDDCYGEIYGMVLGIERLIFKEIVSEMCIGASGGTKVRPNRRRRLFSE